MHNHTGEVVRFDDPTRFKQGQRLLLNTALYPTINVVPRNSRKLRQFGNDLTISVADGTWGMFEEDHVIVAKDSGKQSVSVAHGRYLHALPTTPQIIELPAFEFTSANYFPLKLISNIAVRIMNKDDAVRVSKYIQGRSAKFTSALIQKSYVRANVDDGQSGLADVHAERQAEQDEQNQGYTYESILKLLQNLVTQKLQEKLKAYKHTDLVVVDGEGLNPTAVATSIGVVERETLEELREFVHANTGVTITRVAIVGGIQFADAALEKQFADRALSREAVKTAEAAALRNRAAAMADSEAKTVGAKNMQEIATLTAKAEFDRQRIQLEQEAAIQAQKRELAIKDAEAAARQRVIALEQETQATKMRAQAEADAVLSRAEAQAQADKLRNDVAAQMPASMLELRRMELQNAGLAAINAAVANMPDVWIKALAASHVMGSAGAGGVGATSQAAMFAMDMMRKVGSIETAVVSQAQLQNGTGGGSAAA